MSKFSISVSKIRQYEKTLTGVEGSSWSGKSTDRCCSTALSPGQSWNQAPKKPSIYLRQKHRNCLLSVVVVVASSCCVAAVDWLLTSLVIKSLANIRRPDTSAAITMTYMQYTFMYLYICVHTRMCTNVHNTRTYLTAT